jgi:hypothetical protein
LNSLLFFSLLFSYCWHCIGRYIFKTMIMAIKDRNREDQQEGQRSSVGNQQNTTQTGGQNNGGQRSGKQRGNQNQGNDQSRQGDGGNRGDRGNRGLG